MHRLVSTVILILVGCNFTVKAILAQSGMTETIATKGQVPPGGNGTISTFSNMLINSSGVVSFYSDLVGTAAGNGSDNYALYSGSGGSLTQVMREGQTVPGGNGRILSLPTGFDFPLSNSAGTNVFKTFLTGTSGGSSDDEAIYTSTNGILTKIARKGEFIPSIGSFTSLLLNPDINENGVVGFEADLPAANGTNGVFKSVNGVISRLARRNQATPDGNGLFFTFDLPLIMQNNELLFRAQLTGNSGGSADDSGIYVSTSGGGLSLIVREGSVLPGGNGTFAVPSSARGYDPSTIAFRSQIAGSSGGANDDTGLFASRSGTLSIIAREGDRVQGNNGEYSTFTEHSLSTNGFVTWISSIRNATSGPPNSQALFVWKSGSTQTIVRQGDASPDGNGTIGTINAAGLAITSSGAAVFKNSLVNTLGGTADDSALMIADTQETVIIAREGMPLGSSTISQIDLTDTDQFLTSKTLNDFGQVTYLATLADGGKQVIRWTPELSWRGGNGSWDNNARWTLGLEPAAAHDVNLGSSSNLEIGGPAGHVSVRSLKVGGGTGRTNLILLPSSEITTAEKTEIFLNSALSGSGRVNGKIENHGGIIAVSGGEQLTLDSVLQNGTMEIEQSTQSRIVVNGAYTGNHGITGGGELLILGELSPGLSLAQIPMDGNLALGTSAVTRIEIGGTGPLEYDAVSASGMIRLEGHLDVKMVDVGHGIYQPSFGDTFQILTAMQGFDGTRFTSSSLPELDPNGSLVWQIEQGIGTFELQVGSRADFDGNGSLGCSDVDSLVMRIAAGIHQSHFDLTGDGLVTHADLTQWLSDAGSIRLASGNSFLVGDANLDGVVDGSDFNIWNSAKFTQTAAWCSGDFNADGGVDGSDFALWNSTKFTSADSGSRTQIVPEPSLCRLIGLAFFVLGSSCRNTAFRLRTKN